MPNTLNFAEDILKFATFWENPYVIIFVLSIFVVYFLLLVWARKADTKDDEKVQMCIICHEQMAYVLIYK